MNRIEKEYELLSFRRFVPKYKFFSWIVVLTTVFELSNISCTRQAAPKAPNSTITNTLPEGKNKEPLRPTKLPQRSDTNLQRLSALRCSPIQIERDDNLQRRVALTFDGDWNASATISIVRSLVKRDLKATFFLTGHFCHAFPKECQALKEAGMEIGSHSYSHPRFKNISNEKILRQLTDCEEAMQQRFEHGTKPLFRFPYGESDARSCKAVATAGFQPIYWSLDSLDGYGEEKSGEFISRRVLARVKPGDIVLMHVSSAGTASALPEILDELQNRGLKEVPVSEMLLGK